MGPIVGFGLLAAVWLAVVLAYWATGRQESIAPVGDALAPIGSILTALALWVAYSQRRDDLTASSQQRHEDAEAAHRDRLANAYAEWFKHVRTLLREMDFHANQARRMLRDKTKGASAKIRDARRMNHDVRGAASTLLLLEDDDAFRKRIEETFKPLPMTQPPEAKMLDAYCATLHEEFVRRRKELEALFSDVIVRLKRGNRPEPMEISSIDEADEVPAP